MSDGYSHFSILIPIVIDCIFLFSMTNQAFTLLLFPCALLIDFYSFFLWREIETRRTKKKLFFIHLFCYARLPLSQTAVDDWLQRKAEIENRFFFCVALYRCCFHLTMLSYVMNSNEDEHVSNVHGNMGIKWRSIMDEIGN